MDGNVEMAVIIICGVAGYFAVSLLIDAFRKHGLLPGQAQRPVDVGFPVNSDATWARSVLGVDEYADAARVKERYYELLGQYHPDKTHHLGPEIQQLAADKTREIIRARKILEGSGGTTV